MRGGAGGQRRAGMAGGRGGAAGAARGRREAGLAGIAGLAGLAAAAGPARAGVVIKESGSKKIFQRQKGASAAAAPKERKARAEPFKLGGSLPKISFEGGSLPKVSAPKKAAPAGSDSGGGGLPVGPFFKPIAICGAAVAGIAALLRAVDDESLNFIIEGDGMAKNLGGYVGGEAQLKDPVKGYWKGDYKVQRKESKPRPLTPAKLKADKLQIPVLEAPVDLDFDVPKTAAPKAAAGSGTVFNFNAGGTKKVAPKKKSAPKKKVAPKGTVFSPSFGAPAKKAASKPKPAAKKAAPKPKPAAPKSTKKGTSEWKGILLPGRVEL